MNRVIPHLVFLIIGLLFASIALAATVWTLQPEKYYKYNTTPHLQSTNIKYIQTTDIEAARDNWEKIGNIWLKEISTGGAPRYSEEIIVAPQVLLWNNCASEGGVCSFTGTRVVRYGVVGKFIMKTITNSAPCGNNVFGDPAIGVRKYCEVSTIEVPLPPALAPAPTPAPVVAVPNAQLCDAQFVCREDWGWIVRISENQVSQCLEIKIKESQALFYEGLQANQTKCP